MDIGFIGAGKVGISLGRYLKENHAQITGYYSMHSISAQEAAEFTGSKYYETISQVVDESDVLFLTVPDGQIHIVWEQIKELSVADKIICHCSGALSSAVFSEIDQVKAFGYSIHPLFAVSDKFHSYKELSKALFTIEGSPEKLEEISSLFLQCKNQVEVIDASVKTKYHAAAVVASNLVVSLADMAQQMLLECGFTNENASKALNPLFLGNAQAIASKGVVEALTGPVERCDMDTVEKHLSQMEGQEKEIYRLLSLRAVQIAKSKHPDRNYGEMKRRLEQ